MVEGVLRYLSLGASARPGHRAPNPCNHVPGETAGETVTAPFPGRVTELGLFRAVGSLALGWSS